MFSICAFIIENGKDFEILSTNLQPFFWRKVKTIIRQNKKGALFDFLFGLQGSIAETDPTQEFKAFKEMEEKIQRLQNEVDFLKQKLKNLENTLESQTLDVKSNMLSEGPKRGYKIGFRSNGVSRL